MRKWLHWWGLGALALAIANGCGGGSSATNPPGDDAGDGSTTDGTTTDTGGSDGTQSDVGSSDGNDASTGDDSSSVDAGIDINFPDTLTMPETGFMDTGGGDGGVVEGGCQPNGILCNGNIADDCNNGILTVTDCTKLNPPQTCSIGYGCVVCQPGTGTCNGNVGTSCKPDGSGYTTNTCDSTLGESCNPNTGECDGDCAHLADNSNIGCEYYAVTMLNHLLDQGTFYYSVSVSNTSTNKATVTVTGGALGAPSVTSVPAGQLVEIKLPWVPQLSCGVGPCNASQPLAPSTTLMTNGAYHIKSTEPITVYQFNARDYQVGGAFSYTNDASLLIPVNAMTGNYRVASNPTFYIWPGLMTVIATQNNTTVKVATPANSFIQSGSTTLTPTGGSVTMQQGDVLQIMTKLDSCGGLCYGSEPSGTSITANNPIEVFGGHSCIYTPANTGYCDHTEQIMLPVETLRSDYLVTLPYNANGTPRQFITIVGTTANTQLVFDPPAVHANVTIGAGQIVQFETTEHFHVTASNATPFLVAQYMEGSDAFGSGFCGAQNCGDPSMTISAPTPQFRDNYQFVAPQNYFENWVNVVAASGSQITVDGAMVPANTFTPIGNSGYGVAKVALCDNQMGNCSPTHLAKGNKAFGIQVYGYGAYTSYEYPGGLNLTRQ
jgi:hypothetical protein